MSSYTRSGGMTDEEKEARMAMEQASATHARQAQAQADFNAREAAEAYQQKRDDFPWKAFEKALGSRDGDDADKFIAALVDARWTNNDDVKESTWNEVPIIKAADDAGATELAKRIRNYVGETGGRRRSRLNVKGRRTQRHRGGRKHRKLRKLTTRRR